MLEERADARRPGPLSHRPQADPHGPQHQALPGARPPRSPRPARCPGTSSSRRMGPSSWRGWPCWARGASTSTCCQHLMGYLKKDLSSEDKQELLASHRGLPAGAGAADRAAHPAAAPPASPPGAGLGGAASVPQPLPQGADAAESRVGEGSFAVSPEWWYTFSGTCNRCLVSTDQRPQPGGNEGP